MDFKTKTQCSGQCCQDVTIGGLSKEQLVYKALKAVDEDDPAAEQYAFIADMVVPLVGESPIEGRSWAYSWRNRFGCRHFDKENKICKVYDQRPMLCRSYPNDRPCEFKDCTWDPEEAKLVSHVTSQVGWWNKPECSEKLVKIGENPTTIHGFKRALAARIRRAAKLQGVKMNDAVSKAAASKALTALAQRLTDKEELNDLVIELAVKEAKEINEKGVEAQVSFIVDEVGPQRAEEMIRGKHREWNEVTDPEVECLQDPS